MGALDDRFAAQQQAKGLKPGVKFSSAVSNPNLGAKEYKGTEMVNDKNFAVELAKGTGRIAGGVLKAGANFVANTAKDIAQTTAGTLDSIGRSVYLIRRQNELSDKSKIIDKEMADAVEGYKSGKLSKQDYLQKLSQVNASYNMLNKQNKDLVKVSEAGGSPTRRAADIVETGVNILTLGSLTLQKAAGKQALKMGSKEGIEALATQGATKLESAIMRVPAVKSLVLRNLASEAKLVGSETLQQYMKREGSKVAMGLLVKRPLFYQANIDQARSGLDNIMKGNYTGAVKDAAWLAVQAIDGGPLGVASKGYSWLKGKTEVLTYGKGSLIDEISRRVGDGNATQIAQHIMETKAKDPTLGKKVEEAWRVVQEVNSRIYGKNVENAADSFLSTYHGQDLSKIDPQRLVDDLIKWRDADVLAQKELQKLVKAGTLTAEEAQRYTPVRWDAGTRDAIAKTARDAGPDIQKQWAAVQKELEIRGLDNNQNLMLQLEKIVNDGVGPSGDVFNAIKEIDAAQLVGRGISSKVNKEIAKLGFIIAEPKNGRRVGFLSSEDVWNDAKKLISSASKGEMDLFDPSIAPQPQVKEIANILRKAGLSPEAAAKEGQKKLAESFVANIDALDSTNLIKVNTVGGGEISGGQAVLVKLQNYIENKRPNSIGRVASLGSAEQSAITDVRQLRTHEIQEALGIGRTEARNISKAIVQAYIDVPMELRGFGDKIVDYLYKANPLHKYYSRIQSALRYTYNPFFRVQETAETKILSKLSANNLIWGKGRGELNDAVKVLDNARIFSSSMYGEAAQDQVLGRITANITQGQKRDLAGLAMDIAKKKGMSLEDMVSKHPDEIEDALRIIVQYGNKGVLASPLARTMNLAFFPMRYNAKVTMIAARELAKQPPAIQKAVLHSMFQFSDWLKSDEGLKWQSDNSEAIKVFGWLTPINSITYSLKLLNGSVNSPSDFGVLGGLPLGVVSQMLDSQGIIKLNTPYVDPKTGDTIPKYIPATVKARASTALGDLLGSMFTYPGRTLGLPGKGESIRKVVRVILDTNGVKGDFRVEEAQLKDLTPLEQNMVRVLKGDTSKEAIDALYSSPAQGQYNGYTIPPLDWSPLIRRLKPVNDNPLPRKGKSTKKAKNFAQPIQ